MKKNKNKIRKFLTEFTAFVFLLSIGLSLMAPITSAQTGSLPGTNTSTSGTQTPEAVGTRAQIDQQTTTDTTGTVVQPGADKKDYIYIPLDTQAYKEFPQLTQQTPTGMLYEFVNGLMRNAKFIIGAMAVLYIMLAAIKLIIGGNNEETVTKQKSAIMYGIIGLMIIGFADEVARVVSVACAPGQIECARGGFLKDPNNIIQQAGLFKAQTRIFITFIKYLIGGIAVLMLVINGIRLVGMSGNEENISSDKKNIIFTSIGLILIVIASTFVEKVLYIVDPSKYTSAGLAPAMNVSRGVQEVVGITNFVVTFTAPLAILVLIAGAVIYATAGGNEEQTNRGKRLIISAIIGMILIYGAFAIISTVVSRSFSP